MKQIHVVAHTHWDFEWYFTRQEAKVQFAFHMDEVFAALENNDLNYYVLDGQMSILEDYLALFPEKEALVRKFVAQKRLFIGPWYTQIDEMVTSGESIVRNLRLGMESANNLGGTMEIGYLPDTFGQSQDMPKIYKGLGMDKAIFWRGIPPEIDARYFYWTSNDGSKVLTANIHDGYVAGSELIDQDNFMDLVKKTEKNSNVDHTVLPTGGDQRPVDFNLKERIALANQAQDRVEFVESNYENFFTEIQDEELPHFSGEFVEPSVSKIHRGIYSSRADLKRLYDQLERIMTYQVEPLHAVANEKGLETKQGLIDEVWEIIALGQAHDSSGACNSDKTNADIRQRGINALQQAESLRNYLLRKMSISVAENSEDDLFMWNPLPFAVDEIREFELTTKEASFELRDDENKPVNFDILEQKEKNAAVLRRNEEEMTKEHYYVTTIACPVNIPAMDWVQYQVVECDEAVEIDRREDRQIENDLFAISMEDSGLALYDKKKDKTYESFLTVEDGGDEGDNYDFSPAYHDWILDLNFTDAAVEAVRGELISSLHLKGQWDLPYDLEARKEKLLNTEIPYELTLELVKDKPGIKISLKVDNQAKDHRLRLVFNTDVKADYSYADTPFGIIDRPVEEEKLATWKEIGYKEEPTSLRPMIHFANTHSDETSWTFLGKGAKVFQLIGEDFDRMAVTILRGVGYLGRPDMLRRPGDASGLQTRYVETPDSQLIGEYTFEGTLLVEDTFDPNRIQREYVLTTQDQLFYQNQDLNEFTTPIQYFNVNKLRHEIEHSALIEVEDLKVTFSSLQTKVDGSGYELRLYNATDSVIENPGKLKLERDSNLMLLNLRGELGETLANNIKEYALEPFNPGEIRTYGIFPNKKA